MSLPVNNKIGKTKPIEKSDAQVEITDLLTLYK